MASHHSYTVGTRQAQGRKRKEEREEEEEKEDYDKAASVPGQMLHFGNCARK